MNKTLTRFLKYFLIGFSTFLLDLCLLFLLTDMLLVNYLLATGMAFVIAVSANYYFSRKFVFFQTTRKVGHGYYAFLGIAGAGLVLVIVLMALFVEVFHMNYILSRILVAGMVGMWSYLMNLFLNFQVAGRH